MIECVGLVKYNVILDSFHLLLEICVNMNLEYEAHFAEKSAKGHRESQGQDPKAKLIFNSHHNIIIMQLVYINITLLYK